VSRASAGVICYVALALELLLFLSNFAAYPAPITGRVNKNIRIYSKGGACVPKTLTVRRLKADIREIAHTTGDAFVYLITRNVTTK